MIEKNNVSPSISSLKKVLSGIPMSLIEFFDTDENDSDVTPIIYRGDDIQLIQAESGIEWRLIGKHFPGRKMTFMIETYPPGSDTGEELFSHEGEEAGIILSGQLDISVNGKTYTLSEGEGYYFEATRPHRFWNPYDKPCRLVSSLAPANL